MYYQVIFYLFLIFCYFIICCFSQSYHQQQSPQPKVAIIGAGIAGLSAANKFLEKGFQNFEVFEAQNRIGGRILPVKYSKLDKKHY